MYVWEICWQIICRARTYIHAIFYLWYAICERLIITQRAGPLFLRRPVVILFQKFVRIFKIATSWNSTLVGILSITLIVTEHDYLKNTVQHICKANYYVFLLMVFLSILHVRIKARNYRYSLHVYMTYIYNNSNIDCKTQFSSICLFIDCTDLKNRN